MMAVELAGAGWVLPLAFVLQGASAVLVVLRLVRGPTGPDRVVAIDALTLLGAAAVALIALASGSKEILDAAVVLALVAFLGTAAFALMFAREAAREHWGGDAVGARASWRPSVGARQEAPAYRPPMRPRGAAAAGGSE